MISITNIENELYDELEQKQRKDVKSRTKHIQRRERELEDFVKETKEAIENLKKERDEIADMTTTEYGESEFYNDRFVCSVDFYNNITRVLPDGDNEFGKYLYSLQEVEK